MKDLSRITSLIHSSINHKCIPIFYDNKKWFFYMTVAVLPEDTDSGPVHKYIDTYASTHQIDIIAAPKPYRIRPTEYYLYVPE